MGISKSMKRYLEMHGINCQTESDGRNGLELIRLKQHDLIILDIALPNFSGLDIINELKKNNEIGNYKIIVNTASVFDDDVETDLHESGILDVLYKPVDPKTLLCKIKNVVKK